MKTTTICAFHRKIMKNKLNTFSTVQMSATAALVALACGFMPTASAQAAGASDVSTRTAHKQGLVELSGEPKFNFSVADLPAAQAFALLGSSTAYNVIVPAGLEGKVTISLKDVSMAEALQSLNESYGFDYKMQGRRVVILPNSLTTRIFKINYLVGHRQGDSSVQVQSSSFTQVSQASTTGASSSTNGSGAATGASRGQDSSRVSTSSDADFWRDVKSTLGTLISGEGRSVVLNPAAGVLVVRGMPKEINLVEEYLKAVQISVQRQVMIEAKIIEVSLSNGAQSGINWSIFGGNGSKRSTLGVVAPGVTLGQTGTQSTGDVTISSAISTGLSVVTKSLGTGFYGLAFQGANFSSVLNFLESQGGVQVLSSPRIATLNNQKALLKVGSDEFYVTNVTTSSTTSGNNTITTPSISMSPFFSGISLDVTPQVDDEGMVTMHVHPSISNVTEKQKLVDLGSLGQFQLPSASSAVNETDSIVRIRSGQIAAIGGLMTQVTTRSKSGLPGISEAPVVGALFGQKYMDSNKREIVILIRPTVVEDDQTATEEDFVKGVLDRVSEPRRTGAK